jgi:heme/copper-type cytochrome/quinol oxidase subunit 2
MIHTGMVGAVEAMLDDRFAAWIEKQSDALLASLPTFELYKLYVQATQGK